MLEELEEIIFEDYENSLLSEDMKNKIKEAQEKTKEGSLLVNDIIGTKSINNKKNKKICQQ
jgi:hypothetical protein